jgi:hypothetical protein
MGGGIRSRYINGIVPRDHEWGGYINRHASANEFCKSTQYHGLQQCKNFSRVLKWTLENQVEQALTLGVVLQ